MNARFYVGRIRNVALCTSRYKTFTYGKNSFTEPAIELASKGHGSYGALLFDKRWIAKRLEIIQRDNNACVICKSNDDLQVHHRQYHFIKSLEQFKAPWDYENDLMVTLCENCHTRGHRKYRIPNVYL